MKKFEYRAVVFQNLVKGHHQELDIAKLNDLGDEGWEFVTVSSGNCIFKRELTED